MDASKRKAIQISNGNSRKKEKKTKKKKAKKKNLLFQSGHGWGQRQLAEWKIILA